MSVNANADDRERADEEPRHRVRLPGFLLEDTIGLGEALSRATATFGIRPCGGCQRRAAALNRWLVFTGTRRR
jgi:hypothetical protein